MDAKIPAPAYGVVAHVAATPSVVLYEKCDSESRVPTLEKETTKKSYKWSKEEHQVHTHLLHVELYPHIPTSRRKADGTMEGNPGKAVKRGSITDHREQFVACFMEGGQPLAPISA
ncbi:hypothetical protein L6164_006316 [Bauhinia variegata]|uniref:Uncharacterized protein n=1 Tax=Bauhinia variegata TaxID=167791 RepID=A0ACB9PU53_BAUVA|nr:hypothetical protein L6164_006316 [Bauhinia variegata]